MNTQIQAAIIGAIGSILTGIITALIEAARRQDGQKTQPFSLSLIVVILVTGILVGGFVYWKLSNALPDYPHSDGLIANFSTGRGGPPRNALGETFNPTLDNEWNGQSKCWYRLQWEENQGQGNAFLRLYFQLVPRPKHEAYVGVFTDFSYPPAKLFDVSKFQAVSLRVRMNPPIPKDVSIFVVLNSANVPPKEGVYDFPEYQIPPKLISESWQTIDIPFSSFKAPTWSTRAQVIKFDPTRVFRFSLSLRSCSDIPLHGYVDLDDITFKTIK